LWLAPRLTGVGGWESKRSDTNAPQRGWKGRVVLRKYGVIERERRGKPEEKESLARDERVVDAHVLFARLGEKKEDSSASLGERKKKGGG